MNPFSLRCWGWIVLWEKKAKTQLAYITEETLKDWCKIAPDGREWAGPTGMTCRITVDLLGGDKGQWKKEEVVKINFGCAKFSEEPALLTVKNWSGAKWWIIPSKITNSFQALLSLLFNPLIKADLLSSLSPMYWHLKCTIVLICYFPNYTGTCNAQELCWWK